MVESSIGHVRDLPKRAADVPPKFKKLPWARLGVDVENEFKPLYIVDPNKKPHITKLRELLKEADELLLATDEDREGESIAWHLLEVLKPKVPVKRMVFHEITKKAIQQAIDAPRDIDRHLVDAQEARRILDRLYGYEVSPVLWKKVMPRLSAGRVQSVATRIVVDRERARMRFRSAKYWSIDATFATQAGAEFQSGLARIDDVRLATGKDFGETGTLSKTDVVHLDETRARALSEALKSAQFKVTSVETKPYKRTPSAPFMTSTLQQEAGLKLRFSAARTMRAAQHLYENGYITYMRTDSTTLSEAALSAARSHIQELYGDDYVPKAPRIYAKKVKNAQEAHEAIRPAGETFRKPEDVQRSLSPDEARIYELVWKRTVASQMADARGQSLLVKIAGQTADGQKVEFSVRGNTITFPGFLRAYVEGSDDPNAELENREKHLPPLKEGDALQGKAFTPQSHETQPPARFTEASLVRRLEELGVGRPSTYASIISTIQDRGYVWRKGSALVPSFRAFAVVTLLEQHFGHLVDYAFTAKMEDDLDAIAKGSEQSLPWLRRFYFGAGEPENDNAQSAPERDNAEDLGLQAMVSERLGEIDARAINTIPLGKDDDGREVAVRVGRYGPYLQREEDTARIPDDIPPDELNMERATELLNAPSGDRELGTEPETGLPVLLKAGRFGAYVQLGPVDPDKKEKPKTASLLKSMSPDTLSLEDALKLLTLPRDVGPDPSDGQMIVAHNGRYGPYLVKGDDKRSLERDDEIFTVTVEQALALFAQPKKSRRRAAAEPLRTLGDDPVSGKLITLRQGRFGPYVTDGETNASLRTGDDPESITEERAQELLQLRRDRGPTTKRAAKKKPAKKSAAKKSAAKKSTAKKTTKKAAKPTKKKATKATKKAAPKIKS